MGGGNLSPELMKKLEEAGFVSKESFKMLQAYLKDEDITPGAGRYRPQSVFLSKYEDFVEKLDPDEKEEIEKIEIGGGYRKRKSKRRKSKRKKSKRKKSKSKTRRRRR